MKGERIVMTASLGFLAVRGHVLFIAFYYSIGMCYSFVSCLHHR